MFILIISCVPFRNMHRAVGTYFDVNSEGALPSMSLVRDENSENVLQLPPNLR